MSALFVLSVALGAVAGLLALWVTFRPPERSKHRLFMAVFSVLALLGVAVTLALQVRSDREKRELERRLTDLQAATAKIESQTKEPPKINVNLPAPVVHVNVPPPPVGLRPPSKPSDVRVIWHEGITAITVARATVKINEAARQLRIYFDISNVGERAGEGTISIQTSIDGFRSLSKPSTGHQIGFQAKGPSAVELRVISNDDMLAWENITSEQFGVQLEIVYFEASAKRMHYIYRGRLAETKDRLTTVSMSNKPG